MSILTPIGGGHVALGAATEAAAPNSNGPPAPATADAATIVGAAAPAAAGDDLYINPKFQVDALSGVVMLQYRDDTGKITRQVPSEYELRSYQLGHGPGRTSGT